MRTIDGEYLKFGIRNSPNPARSLSRITVPRPGERIPIGGETCLPGRKLFETSKGHPRKVTIDLLFAGGSQEVSDEGHREPSRGYDVYAYSQSEEKTPTGHCWLTGRLGWHRFRRICVYGFRHREISW